nr:MAG TPA: hypothetical protein [Caudoviricetes sp.]
MLWCYIYTIKLLKCDTEQNRHLLSSLMISHTFQTTNKTP